MTLTLTIYGITSIQPGDIFRVDYLPATYLNNTFFQTMKVTHNIGSDGWYTTLETQFRTRPEVKQDYYPPAAEQSNTILSPRVLESLNLESLRKGITTKVKFKTLLYGMKGLRIEGTQLQSLNYINLLLSFTWVGDKTVVEFPWDLTKNGDFTSGKGFGLTYTDNDTHQIKETLIKGEQYFLIVVGKYWAIINQKSISETHGIKDEYDWPANGYTLHEGITSNSNSTSGYKF